MVTTRSQAKPSVSVTPSKINHKKTPKSEKISGIKAKKIPSPSKTLPKKSEKTNSSPVDSKNPKTSQKPLKSPKNLPKNPSKKVSTRSTSTKSLPAKEPKPIKPTKDEKSHPIYTPDQYKQFKQYKLDLEEKKLTELKESCRKNLMKVSGTKPELIERISDAKILGVIPKCPACGGGRPKLDAKTKTYYCSGYLEDVDFINCHKTFAFGDIQRVAWQD